MSQRALHPEQFQPYVTKMQTEGGFTVDPRTGEEPTSGYMVGQYGTTRKYPRGTLKPEVMAEFAHGTPGYMGGWAGPDADYLERSTRYPDTPSGHTQARLSSMLGNQQSYFDRTEKAERTNPAYESDEQPAQARRAARMVGLNVRSPLPSAIPRTAS